MEIDFDKMELYVQRGDLYWPMEEAAWYGKWLATNPLTGDTLDIEEGNLRYYIRRHGLTKAIGEARKEVALEPKP